MRKRKGLILAAACLVALIVICTFPLDPKEPTCADRPLSYWIRLYDSNSPYTDEAAIAISHIGTNALPCLLHWIEYKPPAWRLWLLNARDSEFGHGWRWIPLSATAAKGINRANQAMVAFNALGPTAQTAIPRLGRLARDPQHSRSSRGAIALAHIGPLAIPELLAILSDTTLTPDARFSATRELDELLHPAIFTGALGTNGAPAVPLLIRNLNDPDPFVAGEAASVLGTLNLQPSVCVPALTAALSNSDSVVRDRAATALPHFGHNARAAVPALLSAMADPDSDVRRSASNALRYIAPKVLTNSTAQ